MALSDDYRRKAVMMREQAARQPWLDLREDYERVAQAWEEMARRMEAQAAATRGLPGRGFPVP